MPEQKFPISIVVLLGCVILAFVWLMSIVAPQEPHELIGGLQPGTVAPRITAEGWLNGEAPTAGKVVVLEAWRLG